MAAPADCCESTRCKPFSVLTEFAVLRLITHRAQARRMNFLKSFGGEAATDGGDAGGAGGGWLASLKEKSKELAEVYKRDIGSALARCSRRHRIAASTFACALHGQAPAPEAAAAAAARRSNSTTMTRTDLPAFT